MKKYVKPELFYERFELSQHIADCQWEMQFAVGTCHATPDKNHMGRSPNLFTTDNGNCFIKDNNWQNYCYQPGTDDDSPKLSFS